MDFNSKTTNTTLTNSLLLDLVTGDLNSRKQTPENPTANTGALSGTRSRTYQDSSLSLSAHGVRSGILEHIAIVLKQAIALIGDEDEWTYYPPSKTCRRNMDSRRSQLMLPSTLARADDDGTTMLNQAGGGGGRVDLGRNTTN